jgi:hypothetical protein
MLSNDELDEFYKNYRENLSRQKETDLQNLNQQRLNTQSTIMSGANKSGMLYSNFPERSKIQYEAQTYQPAQAKIYSSYQTGLDTLRNNILKNFNSIKDIQDQIAHLNSLQ